MGDGALSGDTHKESCIGIDTCAEERADEKAPKKEANPQPEAPLTQRRILKTIDITKELVFVRTDTLYLSIKQVYFDAILSGNKKVENRQIKPSTVGSLTQVDKLTMIKFAPIPLSQPMRRL